MADIASIIGSGFGGVIVGFFANYFLERFKRRNAMSDASRKAYASWFTAEGLLLRRVDIVCSKLVGFPTDRAKHDALMVEIGSLVEEGRTLITSMNEAYLTEQNRKVRSRLSSLHSYLINVVGTLEFAARHHKENLEFHESFDGMTDEKLAALPDVERQELISMREEFKKHDAECPFKSSAFREKLTGHMTRIHDMVEGLRDILAGTLSR
jgi:hypothetical protein